MRVHSFQHVAFEDIGSMAADFARLGLVHTTTHWYRGDTPPPLSDLDALVVMGGPMGVHDEQLYPWLAMEKDYLRSAIAHGKRILGICLGAQLIANVLGAKVTPNAHREIGWFPLQVEADSTDPVAAALRDYPEVFHWHGDTFALPPDAKRLARSEGCENQAFVFGERVWAFQFHLETTPKSAMALLEHCAGDIDGSRYTQSAETMLRNQAGFTSINAAMSRVADIVFAKAK